MTKQRIVPGSACSASSDRSSHVVPRSATAKRKTRPAALARRASIVLAALALVAGALALAGCGSSGTSTATGSKPGDGKQIFADAGCAGCHTLKAAGSDGSTGPNLDDLQPSAAAVSEQVKNGGGGMPSFDGQLTAAQITAVAEFVSGSAGR